ncbi:Ig-like domain-containing protein [Planctomycetes bacterium TBK1r]|uniref:peptidylprolyl isomerase n=1 Tax=Stieleria magnilauensis TaxID=2527963 RepID=A0ABX5XTQ8_9BACT|nr:Putative bifunctional phosphatase/peptidyl-prolyl cis-trans isomerase [Planctomycetes bacterium TBK1r]
MFQGREKRVRRSRLSRLLGQLGRNPQSSSATTPRIKRGERLKLESLEARQLLAGDVSIVSTDSMGPIDARAEVATLAAATAGSTLTTVSEAEGESAPDLVQFAKDLAAVGRDANGNPISGQGQVTFFGAAWCPACTEQKHLFEDGQIYLPFVEVTNPDRSISQLGIDNNITAYPTWVFPDGSRETGVLTLQQLSDRSGVPIPQGGNPTFVDIGDQTALIGSPLHVPVDAYDPDGGPLTVTVSVADSNLLEASVVSGNRSIRIDMATYGDMVIQMFEQRAPTAAGRVINLANLDFYDDIIFHRVVDDFVIQAGDPTGTGTSGSTLGNFDDDFHPELQHNRKGVISFAKSSDDTNNSQFFLTEVPTRFLDFNHSVFGQLIEGFDVLDAISEHAVNGADRPTTDIAINTIEVFNDTENSLIMLKPTGNGVGSTNVTVTVTDGDGNTHSETFQVDVNNDTQNSQPYLNRVTVPDEFTRNTPATLQMSSTDIEGDAVSYSATVISGGSNATASIDQNGLLTVTPATGFTGTVDVQVTVRPGPGVTGNSSSDSDNQVLTFNFAGEQVLAAPTSIDLSAGSDTGSSDSDNITNSGSLAFVVDGVTSGATVQLINQQTSAVLGEAVASGTSVTITTNNIAALGEGTYNVTARQIFSGQTSEQSAAVSVTYDTTVPTSVTSSANTRANVGRLYETDLINSEEGSITYALTQFPVGATINAGSGVIQWTPDAGDVGDTQFSLAITDLAGNTRTENFTVTVAEAPKAEVKLVLRDTDGNEVSNVNVGDEFVLELVGVDARGSFDRDGVFAIYTDILFDSSIIRVKGGTTIEYVGNFTLSPKGTFSTGLIDELGAASTAAVATGEAESVIARVRMEAIAAGSVNIRSEEADEPSSEMLLYGEDDQIPADSVFFGNVNLTVGLDFTLLDDAITVAEDSGAMTINVLANDTTTGSAALSIVSVTQPASGGTVSVNSGQVSFTPAANFNGTTTFTYRAGDGSGAQDTATVTVTVTPVNDPPTGLDDAFEVVEGTTANRLNVLANDSLDPDTDGTLTVTSVTSNTTGATVEVSSDGLAVDYTPPAGFTGTDTFTYVVSDGQATDTVTVTVTVTSSDAPPTARDNAFTVNEDTAEASFDILANDDRDVDDQAFVIESVGTPSQGGTARFSSDGSTFFYAPAANFFGTETVTYTIRDTGGGVATATVMFTVTEVEDPPPVLNDTVQINLGSGASVVLRLEDLPENVDGDGETLQLKLTTAQQTTAQNGTASVNTAGTELTYTPPSSTFTGTDTLTYSVSDGSGTDSVGTLTIEVLDLTQRNITVRFSGSQGRRLVSAVRLTGTDALGNAVNESPTLDGVNLFFANLLPGDYVVEIPAIPFFSGAEEPQQYTINSSADDGDAVIDAQMGRIKPEYLSIQDWLGSTPQQSALVVVQPGEQALLAEPTSLASESISNANFTLNDLGTELTISGEDDDAGGTDPDTLNAAVLTSNRNIVQPRGQIGDLRLFRVNVDSNAVNYSRTPAANNAANSAATTQLAAGSGEGEQVGTPSSDTVANHAVNSPLVDSEPATGIFSTAGSGEGESVAQATSVSEVAAPMLSAALLAPTTSDDSDAEDEPEAVAVEVSSTGASRILASEAASETDEAEAYTDSRASETESAAESESTSESGLSASSLSRFFRFRR